MNKNLHRILFNEHRGQFMVVAEVDASHGSAACESVATRAPASSKLMTTVGAVSLACLCTIGSVAWLMPAPANAQVVAYRNAPATQQPTILQTSNGVPQVNIQTPSAAGVSRNLYSQFDVNTQGLILNNSRTNAQTQLGGWVQGNPWLANGSAKVILNEVYASNPSYLNGYVEVAGQRAEVVIANPAGISVNGGGLSMQAKPRSPRVQPF
jgi:filamentous hemagglutinin